MKPSFDPQSLQLFVTLARHLSMRRSAGDLQLTTSGISRRLAVLERSWGCRLFDRSPRRMSLTRAGRELLPLAESALERLGALESGLPAAADTNGQGEHQLRIGAPAMIGQLVLPAVLREFREACPHWRVKIMLGDQRQIEAGLRDRQLDLAITLRPSSHDGLAFEAQAEDELHFVLHPLHPWAVERRVELAELGCRRLILPGDNDETSARVKDYFREEGVAIEPDLEIADEETIVQFVRHDLGVGILPRWILNREREQGDLTTLPLGRRRLRREWGILHPHGHSFDFAEHLFAGVCGAVLRQRLEAAGRALP